MAEPRWKPAAFIIISDLKWTYPSLHASSILVSPEKHQNWVTGNVPAMQSGGAQELMIWQVAHSVGVIGGLAPWGGGVIARLMVQVFVSGPDSN